jgi:hypothetical protein
MSIKVRFQDQVIRSRQLPLANRFRRQKSWCRDAPISCNEAAAIGPFSPQPSCPAALTGYSQDDDLGTTTLGVRAEARLSDEVSLTLRGMVGWRHAFGDVNPSALLAFSDGASAFTVSGTPIDRNALVAEANLDWQARATSA